MPNFLSAKVVSPAVADVIILPSSKEYQARSASIRGAAPLSAALPLHQAAGLIWGGAGGGKQGELKIKN